MNCCSMKWPCGSTTSTIRLTTTSESWGWIATGFSRPTPGIPGTSGTTRGRSIKREQYTLAWELDGEVVGFSSVDGNRIVFGQEAFMHLHIVKPERRKNGLGTEGVRRSAGMYFEVLGIDRLCVSRTRSRSRRTAHCSAPAFGTSPVRDDAGPHELLPACDFVGSPR